MNAEMPKVVALDVGGTNVRAGLVSAEGAVLERRKEATPKTGPALLDMVRDFAAGLSGGRAGAIGLAVAGAVDAEAGRVLASPNLAHVVDLPLADELRKAAGVPVRIVNDASAAAVGEKWLGAGRPFDRFILLTLGTGIGGGVIHDGKLLDIASEFGHMSLHPKGPLCHCGRHGCLEAFASGTAMVDQAIKALEAGRESRLKECCNGNIYRITAELIYASAMEGDNLCREILKDAGHHLGGGVANLVTLFSPEAVIFSGGLLGAWSFIEPELHAQIMKLSFKPLANELKILPSTLPDEAGVLGAARLALDLISA